ncbi:MAG: CRISPR-associated protein Cas6, partial [Deltaproteobacteria bacterium]
MRYGKYDFHCRFKAPAILPRYKGSTFRGVFGHALKSVVCALKRQQCDTCLLVSQCIYPLVFETHLAVPVPDGVKLSSPPHPFVIRPPETGKAAFEPDDDFDFSLLLFGDVNDHLPYFIYAFHRMGKLGVGKRINGRRGAFTLESVSTDGQTIYSGDDQRIKTGISTPLPRLSLESPPEDRDGTARLKITLKTPLRLKFKNRFAAELPFHVLIRAMLRRISALMTFYGNGEPPLDYRGLVKRAETVNVAAANLEWFDWKRFSARQDKRMLMGGITGTVTFEGALGTFMPLIEFCEKVHIGKQT